jgi:tetratricopeptide (TPR) repeat protein
MSIGITRLRAGRMAEAIAPLESAAATYRDSSEVHRILGTAYGAIGSDAKAIEQLQLAVRLAPGDERGRLALARAQRDAGRLDEAEQSMRETLTVLPGSAEARWTLAGVLEKAGRGIEAARELQAAGSLTVVAGKAALDWQAAEIYDLHQDFNRVAALLRQRVRLEPNNPMVHKQLGLVQNRLGRSVEAFAELAMVDVLGGADAESLTALGQLLLGADRLEDAESALRRAVAMEPERQEARYALGRTLVRRGRASEAREQLDAFERIRDRAMDDQRRTFEIDKLRAEAAAQSAAGHLSEVAALWGQIVERMPGVAEFQAAAADALAAIGEFQKAALHLEKAATLGAGPAVQLRLAEIYAKLGRREESEQARQAYERRMKDLLKTPPSARP